MAGGSPATQGPAVFRPADPNLLPVPLPDVDALEEAVQEQLRSALDFLKGLADEEQASPTDLSEAFGWLGRLYHAYDLRDSAAACYRNAHHLAPSDFRWAYYVASVYRTQGKLDDAVTFYDRALSLQSSDLPSLVHLGEIYVEQNQLENAENMFRKALSLDSRCPAALTGLGQVALARRDFAAAADHFQAALSLVPEADRLHYLLAMAFRGLGDTDKARRHLEQSGAVGTRVHDPLIEELSQLTQGEMAHILRGRLAFRFGRYQEAADEFRRAVAADPTSYRARVNLGTAFGEQGEFDSAVEQYREALRLSPEGASAHFNLGHLLARSGQYEAAIQHLYAAVKTQPDDVQAYFELAEALKATGAFREALTHYGRAAELDPANEKARLGEVDMLFREKRYREALDLLNEAHTRFPQDGLTTHVLARLLAGCRDVTLRDGRRALDLAYQVFQAKRTVTHAETVAMALAELSRCEEAARWQRSAIASAEREGRNDLVEWYREALVHYERGVPCRPQHDPP